MWLRPADLAGRAQSSAEGEADQHTAEDSAVEQGTAGSTAGGTAGGAVGGSTAGGSTAGVRPTFTPTARQPADDNRATTAAPARVTTAPARVTAAPAPETAAPSPVTGAAGVAGTDLDLPLFSSNSELVSRWQRTQAEFVDHPQVAVAAAADLVEQAAQALVDALELQQRKLRASWAGNGTSGSAAPGDTAAGTEQLRQVMLRYRALFNQLCQPVQS